MGQFDFDHHVTTHYTKSGIGIVDVTISNYPISTTSLWINAGSIQDPLNKKGISHLFEHIFLTRTDTFPDRINRLAEIERNGMHFNAFTSLQYQHYYYVHNKETSVLALNLLIDGLSGSLFENQDIEREKKVVLEEESENRNDPSSYIWRAANRGMWGVNTLGKDFYGSERTIKSIKSIDMLSFFEDHFTYDNTSFVFINSGLSMEEKKYLIDKIRLTSVDKKRNSTSQDQITKVANTLYFERREMNSVQLALSFNTTPFIDMPNNLLQQFMSHILAGSWSSTLIQKLRIKDNVTYWVYPDTQQYENAGYIRFTLSVSPESVQKVLNAFESELTKLKLRLLQSDKLSDFKKMFIANIQRQSVDYNWLMNWYGYPAIFGKKLLSINDSLAIINKINSQSLNDFALKYFNQEMFSLTYLSQNELDIELPTFQ